MITQRTFTISPFNSVRRTFDDLLETAFDNFVTAGPVRAAGEQRERPLFVPVNLWEDDASVYVECELPGFRMEDVELSILKNVLTISGRRAFEFPENANIRLRERLGDRFSRDIELPVPVDADSAQAQLRHGILRVTLPKAQRARARKIEVQSA